ncbi:nitroreductase [Trypanosoma theileri]|uniref:Nitroreductase n=1 Tax=Trypanosoma theileri TaxID=67003 RepID=A0A1X0NKR5_9TRYP|nr:nitroreductase [Trypanosoma theileri]ORC85053.1 nitroreductase [Trypanosoma theileri]
MRASGTQRRLLDSILSYWSWKKSNVAGTTPTSQNPHTHTDTHKEENPKKEGLGFNFKWGSKSSSSSLSSVSSSSSSSSSLAAVREVVERRRSCRRFDPAAPIDPALLADLLTATTRAPTAFNLQPWVAVVVQEAAQREALAKATLDQIQPREAPVTIIFAGDTQPVRNAAAALEMGLESGHLAPTYGAVFLRHVYYQMHAGPLDAFAHIKGAVASNYSAWTGTPMLSVPTNMQAYAWKQTMIPATTFVYLATAAGLDTSIIEGFDEAQVRNVVQLPSHYTIPVIVSVGYGTREGFRSVKSPRFPPSHLIRWGKY